MMKLNGLNQLNKKLQEHKTFSVYDNDGLFAKYIYDEELKRYQSDYGYLTVQDAYKISRDEEDERYLVWEGEN